MTDSTLFNDEIAARFEWELADLEALCADRPLRTSEILQANDYYGIARLLKTFAGFPEQQAIRAVIPHGVYLNDDQVVPYERHALLPAALAYPDYRSTPYVSQGRMIAIPFASPFVYAETAVPSDYERLGTLFYPAHSTHRLRVESDWGALADSLTQMPDHYGPVSVMVYWRDYQLDHHLPFVERGLRVVSAGHMFDPDFMVRQVYLMKRHAYIASNAIGSHLFYGIQAGCQVHLMPHEYEHAGSDEHLKDDAPRLSPGREAEVERIEEVFASLGEAAHAQKWSLTRKYLQTDRVMSSENLFELFTWLERIDRFGGAAFAFDDGAAFDPVGSRGPIAVPRAWRRFFRRIGQGIELAGRGILATAIDLARRAFPFLRDVRLRDTPKGD